LKSAQALTTFQWTHLAVTFDGSLAVLYINGQNEASATFNSIIFSNYYTSKMVQCYIGGAAKGSGETEVVMADLKIFGLALSQAEVVDQRKELNEPEDSVELACPSYGFESEAVVCDLSVAVREYNSSALFVDYGDGGVV
jgi:hypothetical protein